MWPNKKVYDIVKPNNTPLNTFDDIATREPAQQIKSHKVRISFTGQVCVHIQGTGFLLLSMYLHTIFRKIDKNKQTFSYIVYVYKYI